MIPSEAQFKPMYDGDRGDLTSMFKARAGKKENEK